VADTEIEWATKVWNFVRGCRRVSPGCGGPNGQGGCYAEKQAYRFSGPGMPYEGLVRLGKHGPQWTGVGRFVPEKLAEPLRWRAPRDGSRHRIFVNSMSDLFFEEFSNEEIAAGFGVMAACPQHDFLILTKRPERAAEWFKWIAEDSQQLPALVGAKCPATSSLEGSACLMTAGFKIGRPIGSVRAYENAPWPLPNVWLGVSVEDQKTADTRVPLLLALPAAVRFVSAEPLLGAIELEDYLSGEYAPLDWGGAMAEESGPKLDWVIIGGESGNGARPFDVQWARDLVNQCADAGTNYFVKQLGRVPYDSTESDRSSDEPHPDGPGADPSCRLSLSDKKGGDMAEWPPELRVRQFPEARA